MFVSFPFPSVQPVYLWGRFVLRPVLDSCYDLHTRIRHVPVRMDRLLHCDVWHEILAREV